MPLMATDNSLVITAPKFLFIASVSLASYVAASYFLNLKEATPIISRLKKSLFKNLK